VAAASSTLGPIISRSLAGELSVSEHETDQRIMDAVIAELGVTPMHKVSLEDVAERAGVTRMTVYRRFGDRPHVIEAALARDISRFFDGLVAADDPDAPPTERIVSSVATALSLAHGHPVLAHVLATNPGQLLETVLADDGAVLAMGSAFIAGHLAPRGRRPNAGQRRTGELLARLFLSLLMMPPPSVDLTDAEQTRALAREVVVPLIA
jgi:AcrR family transcriptional regulator